MSTGTELSKGEVRSFPSVAKMERLRRSSQRIRFTLITRDGRRQRVEILEHATAALNPQDGHVWWGIVCPITCLKSRKGMRAIRVVCPAGSGVGTFV